MLWILSLAMFVIGTTSLSMLGLGSEIAAALEVTPDAAGWLVTAFAATFAIAAPGAQFALAGRLPHRSLIVAGLALLAAGLVWGGLAGSYDELLASRICAALGGALVAPTSAALAIRLAPEARRGRALATVFAGFTLSTVAGVPIATWLAVSFGWRGALFAIGALAALACLATLLHRGGGAAAPSPAPPSRRAEGLRRIAAPGALLAVTFCLLAAQFVIYALMAELLTARFGLAAALLPAAMLVFGASGVAGNAVAGLTADRLGSGRIVWLSMAGLALMFLAFATGPGAILATASFCGCAFAGTFFTAPQQARLTAIVAPPRHALALALNASASYLGISLGSALASILFRQYGPEALPQAALALVALAALANLAVRPRPGSRFSASPSA